MLSTKLKPTPLEKYPELAQAVEVENLFIKREDLNPSGSHKDRAIWSMLEHYYKQGIKHFVISSSGSAAIAAAYFGSHIKNLKLNIFISPRMSADKKQRLDKIIKDNHNIKLQISDRAKTEAIRFARDNKHQLVRTSTDDLALAGYNRLGEELNRQLIEQGSDVGYFDIFIPTSSGTTLQGLFEYLRTQNHHGNIRANDTMKSLLRLHIVQTTKVNIIAREFDQDFEQNDTSLASAIVDTIGHRKDDVVKATKDSGGSGWVISDSQLQKARGLAEKNTGIENPSWDSLLSLAGLIKAKKQGLAIKNAIILFTGK